MKSRVWSTQNAVTTLSAPSVTARHLFDKIAFRRRARPEEIPRKVEFARNDEEHGSRWSNETELRDFRACHTLNLYACTRCFTLSHRVARWFLERLSNLTSTRDISIFRTVSPRWLGCFYNKSVECLLRVEYPIIASEIAPLTIGNREYLYSCAVYFESGTAIRSITIVLWSFQLQFYFSFSNNLQLIDVKNLRKFLRE